MLSAKSFLDGTKPVGGLICLRQPSSMFNADRGTPLHFAALYGADDIIDVLLHAGVNVNAETKKGLTPLDIALKNERTEAARLLRSAGAKEGNRQ